MQQSSFYRLIITG